MSLKQLLKVAHYYQVKYGEDRPINHPDDEVPGKDIKIPEKDKDKDKHPYEGPPPEVWKFQYMDANKYIKVKDNQKLIGEIIYNIIEAMISLMYGFETGNTSWSEAKPEAIKIFELYGKLDSQKSKLFETLMNNFTGQEFFNALKALKDKA